VKAFSIFFSYDTRKRIRTFATRTIPDSLFDETMRQGLRTGITLRSNSGLYATLSTGVRFRGSGLKNTVSAAAVLAARRLFSSPLSIKLRLAYFSTMFTNGYRPGIHLRLPVSRGLSTYLSGGSYIYKTGPGSVSSHWLETGGTWHIGRHLFAGLGYRTYFDKYLKSHRFFIETGISF
jgi:hypothetical protein